MNETSTDRIEKRIELAAPIDRVWRALTDHQEFGEWFGVKLEAPFVAGQETCGNITCPGYEEMVMKVEVQEMEAQRLFSFRWHPHAVDPSVDYSGEPTTLVEFKIEAQGSGTLLVLTESGFDALPADRREEAFLRNDGGWTQQMKSIESHVTNKP